MQVELDCNTSGIAPLRRAGPRLKRFHLGVTSGRCIAPVSARSAGIVSCYPEFDTVGELEAETYWEEPKRLTHQGGMTMSLPRNGLQPVPVETARVAQAAFPDGNVYLRLRDELGTLFADELFAAVYSVEGQPALHPWQVALVSIMQFMETLSDRQEIFSSLHLISASTHI